jgi:hypothetical protein
MTVSCYGSINSTTCVVDATSHRACEEPAPATELARSRRQAIEIGNGVATIHDAIRRQLESQLQVLAGVVAKFAETSGSKDQPMHVGGSKMRFGSLGGARGRLRPAVRQDGPPCRAFGQGPCR